MLQEFYDYEKFFNQYVRPYLKKGDKPFNRQLFNDSLDVAYCNGDITVTDVNNWTYPKNKWFC